MDAKLNDLCVNLNMRIFQTTLVSFSEVPGLLRGVSITSSWRERSSPPFWSDGRDVSSADRGSLHTSRTDGPSSKCPINLLAFVNCPVVYVNAGHYSPLAICPPLYALVKSLTIHNFINSIHFYCLSNRNKSSSE